MHESESEVWLCDPMDYSLQGSSVYGVFQARVLEWVAIAFSIISFQIFFFIVDDHFYDFKWFLNDNDSAIHIPSYKLPITAGRDVEVEIMVAL